MVLINPDRGTRCNCLRASPSDFERKTEKKKLKQFVPAICGRLSERCTSWTRSWQTYGRKHCCLLLYAAAFLLLAAPAAGVVVVERALRCSVLRSVLFSHKNRANKNSEQEQANKRDIFFSGESIGRDASRAYHMNDAVTCPSRLSARGSSTLNNITSSNAT